jgi:hypothetical protein
MSPLLTEFSNFSASVSSSLLFLLNMERIKKIIIPNKIIPPSTPPISTPTLADFASLESNADEDIFAELVGEWVKDGMLLVGRKTGTMVVPPFGSVTVVKPPIVCVLFTNPVVALETTAEEPVGVGFEFAYPFELPALEPAPAPVFGAGLEVELERGGNPTKVCVYWKLPIYTVVCVPCTFSVDKKIPVGFTRKMIGLPGQRKADVEGREARQDLIMNQPIGDS